MSKKYVLKNEAASAPLSIAYETELNTSQWEVVRDADGPALVLAGAGSGKTRTLVYRVAYLLEKGVHPEEILLVTFTNKASQEMRNRVELLLKTKSKGLWCGTFHHIANRVLRTYGKPLGLEPDFGILDEEDSRDLLKACLKSLEHEMGTGTKLPKPGVIQSLLSFSVNSKKTVAQTVSQNYPYLSQFSDFFEKLRKLYEDRKRKTKSLDYDDLLVWWLELLKRSDNVRENLTARFRYVLVDEYQDTNKLQHEIMTILSERHRNLLVVGDDAQSIYSFRAATIRNILDFPKDFPDCRVFRLETNYRSTGAILAMANHSISQNRQQFPKKLKSVREEGSAPQMVRVRDARQEANFIVQRILELRTEGADLSNIAVLFRAHYQAAELEMELAKRGVDYVVRGGIRFFEQAHIKDVLSYLRIVSNPMDEIAWIRALMLQPGIGMGYADRIFQKVEQVSGDPARVLSEAFGAELPTRVRQGFSQFRAILTKLVDPEKRDKPELLLEEVLERGYSKHLLLNFENARDRLEDLRQLVNFAHSYKGLKDFLADVMLKEGFRGETFVEAGAERDEESPLVLSTIHQAKGLEWKAVFVIGLSEGQFPHVKALDSEESLEEERRLFYVASTRAKDLLFLTQPMMRYDSQAGMVITRPSLFILELSHDLYEEVEVEEGKTNETIYIDEEKQGGGSYED